MITIDYFQQGFSIGLFVGFAIWFLLHKLLGRYMNRRAVSLFNLLRKVKARALNLHLQLDIDYGIDHKQGWTASINGHTMIKFAETADAAVREALKRYDEMVSPSPPIEVARPGRVYLTSE